MQTSVFRYVGRKRLRRDIVQRVTGRIKYAADITPNKTLYAALLHSPYPNCIVKTVDTKKAEELNGVVAVLTPFNVPQHRFGRTFSPVPWKVIKDRRIIDKRQRFAGDIVAAVAAISPEKAFDALDLIEVDYHVLDYVDSVDNALKADAPLVHEEVEIGDTVKKLDSNIGWEEGRSICKNSQDL